MEAVSVSQHLAALFESHRIDCVVHGEWVAPARRLPAIRATWYAGEKTGRLDVDVLLEDERQLQEAFAGIGSGEDGLQDASPPTLSTCCFPRSGARPRRTR